MKRFLPVLFLLLILRFVLATPALAQQPPVIVLTPTVTPAVAPGTESWQFDAEVTEVGKRAERARQFISWVLSHKPINNHVVFMNLWKVTLGVTLALTLVVVAIMGLGLIIARKQDISLKVDVVPILVQVALILLYAIFSYVIVLGLIQITEQIMSFFVTFLGGEKLFSIFFSADPTGDQGYITFVGQRNFDPLVNESAKTSLFLINLSSFTYFAMGIMIIIREIVLWFLLILAPILALLMPFRFIRNVGWIWIGVFFQWAFYGPLFGIFLWALTKIWETGLPYSFNFSRITGDNGVIYPLAINILYGGPQQVDNGLGQALSHVAPINSSSYVDTFVEYVISLIMLWIVIILPWWLLRIFRDYCCDGIYAMKNILMNMMGQGQRPGEPPPGLSSSLKQQLGAALNQNKQAYQQQSMRQEAVIRREENIKNVKTEEISRRMDVQVNKLSDIAKLETQSDRRSSANSNLQYLKNPLSAQNRDQQSEFSRLKTELSTRAASGDLNAKRLLEVTSSSSMLVRDKIQLLAQQQANIAPISQKISVDLQIPEAKINQIAASFAQSVTREQQILEQLSKVSQVNTEKVKQVIEGAPKAASQRVEDQALTQLAKETGVEKSKTQEILKEASKQTENEKLVKEVANKEKSTVEAVRNVGQRVFNSMGSTTAPTGPGPKQEVSIEEYEEMRRMWVEHYTKGEVPVSEKIKDRASWVKEEQVRLDNVLNKIASENEEIRAEGLKEVSDIIPFFILGDMSIQDIAIYLKAKLTAAREVNDTLGKEAVLKERLEKAQTEFVEVEKKETVAKTQELKQALPVEPTPKAE